MKKILIIILILSLFSCKKSNRKINTTKIQETNYYLKSEYFDNNKVLKLKYNAINIGDNYSFELLLTYYTYNPEKYYESLPICIIMADKYNSNLAYHEVYKNFIKIYSNGEFKDDYLNNLDNSQKELAISYLKKGVEKNIPSCLNSLEILYRNGIVLPKNIKKADSLSKINNFR